MTTFVFPGQGSQSIGMSKDFYDNFKSAKLIFEEISDYVDIDLRQLIFDDKENLINLTNYTQIAIFTSSIAIFKTIEDENFIDLSNIEVMMGHSLGEYTALACSKKLDLEQSSKVLKYRGELMHNAVEPNLSGMAALIGMNSDEVEKIIRDNNINLEIANDNSPIQVVVSGDSYEIKKSEKVFLENKIKKFIKLNVSSAFHSKFMLSAQEELNNEIDKLDFKENRIKIISNYSSEISNDNLIIKNALKNQMSNKVRWTESIKKLENIGQNKIIEIGPSKVLSGLIKRISSTFDIKSISNITDL
tara:strand:+ start:2942 stop:3850 length:909 start_codon:yes stop_codon:yes gene_type:complete